MSSVHVSECSIVSPTSGCNIVLPVSACNIVCPVSTSMQSRDKQQHNTKVHCLLIHPQISFIMPFPTHSFHTQPRLFVSPAVAHTRIISHWLTSAALGHMGLHFYSQGEKEKYTYVMQINYILAWQMARCSLCNCSFILMREEESLGNRSVNKCKTNQTSESHVEAYTCMYLHVQKVK